MYRFNDEFFDRLDAEEGVARIPKTAKSAQKPLKKERPQDAPAEVESDEEVIKHINQKYAL